MRSTNSRTAAARVRTAFVLAGFLAAVLPPAPAFFWQEKRVSIYFPDKMITVPVLERNGREYADLARVMSTLGPLVVKRDGRSWKASVGKLEAEFEEGKTRGRIAGKRVELAQPLLIDEGRGLVPVASLGRVLGTLMNLRVDEHASARRIFVGDAATRFTAEAVRAESALVLRFSSSVSPRISTERNVLRMVFERDPVVSGTSNFRFEGSPVVSASFHESAGEAELILQGEAPLLATARDNGMTLVITAAPSAPQVAVAPPQAVPDGTQPPLDALLPTPLPDAAITPVGPPGLPAPVARPRYLVVVDASHGGPERGAALSGEVAEKDVTLSLARRLRYELELRGVQTLMLREQDTGMEMDARAVQVNISRAAVYVTLHAAVLGRGVRVYTSLLAPAETEASTFLPWETAQAGHVEASRVLSGAVVTELGKRRIAAASLAAPIRPLNNVTAAAIAVEVMPPGDEVRSINLPSYQQKVAAAVATAVFQARLQLEPAP